ncbi:ABC transporter permease [Blastomonas sp.]|uniref:ABC transporter permease n=1 Tax=Blastomonas sp. TaxID=1909299 RepID=UPI003919AEED
MHELLRASWVIARRDFAAIIFSKAFFFFLLGPVFPLAIGIAAGSIGGQVARDIDRPSFALVMAASDSDAALKARAALAAQLGEGRVPALVARQSDTPERLLDATQDTRFLGVLTGSLGDPQLIGTASEIERWKGPLELLVERARAGNAAQPAKLKTRAVAQSSGSQEQGRLVTAQVGQALLVLLTMLLAGMVLSNLVEEKTNKIIEILAAAVPIDAIFLGKLFAMLGMALIGIACWAGLALVAIALAGNGVPDLPAPATGWPLFIGLGVAYFAMAYLLLGSLFLGIGAMATTVREVQTLSMPATMGQLLFFFLASYSVTRLGEPIELFAVAFPFSSPFAMLARAAQEQVLWQHLLALAWQAAWVLVLIRFGARLFRRNVLKSGSGAKRGLIAGLMAKP